jgi:glutaconyl-CoA/methylmalonyl-CoA decarboxylase subunit gamma
MNIRVKVCDQNFEVEVGDLNARPILAQIDGETFEVWPEEEAVQPAAVPAPVRVSPASAPAPRPAPAPAAAAAAPSGGNRVVSAPIPGVIIGVSAKPGDTIAVGQELVTLEAMKMKNAIRATRAGKIANVFVTVGDKVRHGQPLVEFTE